MRDAGWSAAMQHPLPPLPRLTLALPALACDTRKGVRMNCMCATGPISSSSHVSSIDSGRAAMSMSASDAPWEWPMDAADGWPVWLRMKSSAVGRSMSASSSMLGLAGAVRVFGCVEGWASIRRCALARCYSIQRMRRLCKGLNARAHAGDAHLLS